MPIPHPSSPRRARRPPPPRGGAEAPHVMVVTGRFPART